MPRYALIRHDDTVDSVIVAHPEFFAKADPKWLAQFKEWREVSETEPAEPGARFERAERRFVAPLRAGDEPDQGLRAKIREILQDEGVVATPAPGGGPKIRGGT